MHICTPHSFFRTQFLHSVFLFLFFDQEKMQCNWKIYPFHQILLINFILCFLSHILPSIYNIQSADAVLFLWRKQNNVRIFWPFQSSWMKKQVLFCSMLTMYFFLFFSIHSFKFIFHYLKNFIAHKILYRIRIWILHFLRHELRVKIPRKIHKWSYEKVSNISFPLCFKKSLRSFEKDWIWTSREDL